MKASIVVPAPSRIRSLLISAVLMEVCFAGMAWLANWDDTLSYFLLLYFAVLAVYWYLVTQLLRKDPHGLAGVSRIIVIGAIIFRATVLFNPPSLSEDFYRYTWDGRIQNEGFGPYDYPPEATELAQLRDTSYERINHKEFRTIYPPFAQNLFRLLARISDHFLVFKLGFLFFDLILIDVLRRLLRKEEKNPSLLLVYAWHPLPVIEFAGSAHMDIISLSLLCTSFLLVRISRSATGGVFYGLAVLSKYVPGLLVPWMLKRGKLRLAIAAVLTTTLLTAQFVTSDLRMFDSLLVFSTKFRFNDSLFGVFYSWFGGAGPARTWGIFFVGLTILMSLYGRFNFYRSAFMVIGAWILFSPVVHPWYLCWIIPFLVFHPSKPWLFFTGWIVISYLVRMLFPDGPWEPVLWLKLLVYLPFYVFLIFDLFRR